MTNPKNEMDRRFAVLSQYVQFTDDETDVVLFKDLQYIMNLPYFDGNETYKRKIYFSKNKLLKFMWEDPVWSEKLNDCHSMRVGKQNNVVIRLRLI